MPPGELFVRDRGCNQPRRADGALTLLRYRVRVKATRHPEDHVVRQTEAFTSAVVSVRSADGPAVVRRS